MSQDYTRDDASTWSQTAGRLGFIPWARFGGGACQVIMPAWLYDLVVFVFYPINWLISALASRLPCSYNRRDWPVDPELVPAKLPETRIPLKEMTEIIRRRDNTRLSDDDIWPLFDSLPAPRVNDMIGNWRGKVVFTGSWLDAAGYLLEMPLGLLGTQWGKRFFTPYKGDPLIFIIWNTIIFPVPAWGNVSMTEIRLRGESGATMVYDHQPWKDHFRVLDDGKTSGRKVMLGNWISREKNGGWFTLEELPEMDKSIGDLLQKSPY